MELNGKIWLARSDEKVFLEPKMANRHGFIAGASGTGKTITLKVLAESFSQLGVPVFLADIKGDLAGMCKAGVHSESMEKRINKLGIEDWRYRVFPTRFWDIYGEYGHPVRTTVSEMGPMLLSRLMDLSDVQSDVLNLVFKIADDKELLLIDIKDLKAMLRYVGENRAEFSAEYGNMSAQSLGAIQRSLITLEDEGGAEFFGEPAIDIRDWMQRDEQGRGYINVLHSVKLVQNPTLYATFMLFLMSELFEKLPERGDAEKPEMVFFFDEAHLLFSDAPKVLVQKIEQVVKLIRSKGVGIYFISQSPSDIPDSVLEKDRWIIDGNYSFSMEVRLKECDAVFFLDYPAKVCLDGVRTRMGKPRLDMPWIEQEYDEEFIQFIKSFKTERCPQIYALLEKYSDKPKVVFKTRAEAEEFLEAVRDKTK